jgi:carbonic anhydrase
LRNVLIAILSVTFAASAQQTAPTPPPTPPGAAWGYYGAKGPYSWGHLDPAYAACSKGKEQSPLDIRGAKRDKSLKPIEIHYLGGPLTLLNTGRTIQGTVLPGSYIVAGGVRYDLQLFHFHHPAEHEVNGKVHDIEIHLIHKNAAGKFAVIAVFMDEGQVNGALAALWPSLPKAVGASVKLDDPFTPAGLLPTEPGYWTYTGSLTAPPCTEDVQWFVMQTPTQLSADQLDAFARLYPVNARQVQTTHGRKIAASE